MFTFSHLYLVLVCIVIGTWLVFIYICQPYPNLLKYHKKILITTVIGVINLHFFVVNPIYIIDDENHVQEYYLLFPTFHQLNNNQRIYLHPVIGYGNAIVVNNGVRNAVFETVIYGKDLEPIMIVNIPAYSAKATLTIEYLFQPPPKQIKIKGWKDIKGWLHR